MDAPIFSRKIDALNRHPEATMYRNILVPTDGSRLSLKAAAHAIDLAKAIGARLTGFHASPDYPLPVYADGASLVLAVLAVALPPLSVVALLLYE